MSPGSDHHPGNGASGVNGIGPASHCPEDESMVCLLRNWTQDQQKNDMPAAAQLMPMFLCGSHVVIGSLKVFL